MTWLSLDNLSNSNGFLRYCSYKYILLLWYLN